jgi:hypothetical protein
VIARLLAVKRGRLVPKTIEAAAFNRRMLSKQRIAQLEADMIVTQEDIARVTEIRERLQDVPALPQRVSVL